MARRAKRAKTTAGISKRRGSVAAPTSKKTPRTRSSKRCYLLEMPPEIRNRICELVLYQPGGIEVDFTDLTLGETHHALARTNRQLKVECGKRFFHVNTFMFRLHHTTDPKDPEWTWVTERAGFSDFVRQHIKSLRSIEIHFGGQDKVEDYVVSLSANLKSLQAGLKQLRANNVQSRFLFGFKSFRYDSDYSIIFDLNLIDRDIAEAEVEKQFRESVAMANLEVEEKEIKDMQRYIGDALYGTRKERS